MFRDQGQKINIEAMFLEIRKDLQALRQSTTTLKQNVQDLHDTVYKDSDSLVNRLNVISNRNATIAKELADIANKINASEQIVRINKEGLIDVQSEIKRIKEDLKTESEKRSKFFWALAVPFLLTAFAEFAPSIIPSMHNSEKSPIYE